MGILVDQPIKTLFNGVSRQPHNVRLPSQHENAENVLFSVVTGGFEGRPCLQLVKALEGLNADLDWALHVIDRDETEQYAVLVNNNGDVHVYDIQSGTPRTVQPYSSSVRNYLKALPENLAFVTVADYTFVVNRQVDVEMNPNTTAPGTFKGSVKTFADLPATAADNDVYRILNGATSLDDYYVMFDSSQSAWVECAKPGDVVGFKVNTMPHRIVREADGTFTVSAVPWKTRQVGDTDAVPTPNFVGRKFKDVFFFKNRLGFIADENVFFSQAGDYFNLWPEQANVVSDADPVDVAASTTKVTILQWAAPFRKALFLVADRAQFELSAADILTPTGVTVDLATSYDATNLARPVTMGDELYFASEKQGTTVIYEYFYDDNTLSNTAIDVTKHAEGYIPGRVYQMVGSPVANTLALVSDADPSSLYTYRVFWNGDEKVQSSWGRWTFDSTYIDGMAVLNDTLYALVSHNDTLCLCKIPLERETPDPVLGFDVKLDWRETVTGTYNPATNKTTFTSSLPHDNEYKVILSGAWDLGLRGRTLQVTYPTAKTIQVTGDYSTHPVYIGKHYVQRVELSRIFMRDETSTAQITGRLQVKDIRFSFTDSGYFEVHVTPSLRDTKVVKMTGRQIGTVVNTIGTVPILSGSIQAPVKSRGDTTKIEIINPTHLPFIVNSAVWRGFYNELSRQG